MKPLEKTFTRNGFEFKEFWRVGCVAIYGKKKPEWRDFFTFEVVIVRDGKAWTAFGQTFEAKELYPSSEDWGTYGFTHRHLSDAMGNAGKLLAAR